MRTRGKIPGVDMLEDGPGNVATWVERESCPSRHDVNRATGRPKDSTHHGAVLSTDYRDAPGRNQTWLLFGGFISRGMHRDPSHARGGPTLTTSAASSS